MTKSPRSCTRSQSTDQRIEFGLRRRPVERLRRFARSQRLLRPDQRLARQFGRLTGDLAASRPSCRCNAGSCRIRRPSEPGCARRSSRPARSSPTSSLINRPWNPIKPRITCSIIVAEVVAGWAGSMAENTTCAVIAIGRSAKGLKAAKSVRSSSFPRRIDNRQRQMAVGGGPAMAGNVLQHR